MSSTCADGERTLLDLQVTTRPVMGAIALETGGVLVDHGWLRIVGAGCPRLPRPIAWTREHVAQRDDRVPAFLLIAND